jgi:hypothetical protein
MDRLTELAAARASGDITASMLLPPRAPGQPAILEFEEVRCCSRRRMSSLLHVPGEPCLHDPRGLW